MNRLAGYIHDPSLDRAGQIATLLVSDHIAVQGEIVSSSGWWITIRCNGQLLSGFPPLAPVARPRVEVVRDA